MHTLSLLLFVYLAILLLKSSGEGKVLYMSNGTEVECVCSQVACLRLKFDNVFAFDCFVSLM
jgi:hypothetical protein